MSAAHAEPPGAAHLLLADQVAYLDPAATVFEAMLECRARQQRTRFLKPETISQRVALVRVRSGSRIFIRGSGPRVRPSRSWTVCVAATAR